MSYARKDQYLLAEAVQLSLLKESMPQMSLKQVQSNLDLMSESELEYVSIVSERILNEFWGGLKNLATAGGAGAASLGNRVKGAAQNVAQGVAGKVGSAVNTAKDLGKGAMAAGTQIKNNAKDIYNAGVDEREAAKAIDTAKQLTTQLLDALNNAVNKRLIEFEGPIENLPLGQVVDALTAAQEQAADNSAGTLNRGFTGGAGDAFKRGAGMA